VTFSAFSANPVIKTVGATTTISVFTLLPSGTQYATGDVLTYTIPSPGSFVASTTVSSCISVSER